MKDHGPLAPPVQYTIQAYLARRRDNFLLLRIVAALMVIYGHSFPLTRDTGTTDIFLRHHWPMYSGDIAVAMFFVISGFMVSGSDLARHDLLDFAKARLLRIVPAFALVLVLCAVVVGPVMTTLAPGDYFRDPAVPAYVFKNLHFSSDMAWQLPGVFQGNVRDAINGSIWTLPAEMRMYLLTAALGAFGLLAHRWLGTAALLALVWLGAAHREYIPLHQDWFRLAGFFALGILVQLHKDRLHVRHGAMLMLALVVYLSMRASSMPWLFALGLAYFCFWFAYRTPTWGWLERWGDPSYGVYLWGWPVQQVLVAKMPGMSPWHNFLIAAVIALCLGYLSWWCLERPVLKLKGWRPRTPRWSPPFRSRQTGVNP
jgi:peptidoglycan/LPS O-acetylase OafA/YrhL